MEVRKILPLLVAPDDPNAPAFHVVALGLPGYGFTEGPKKPGFGPAQMAEVLLFVCSEYLWKLLTTTSGGP